MAGEAGYDPALSGPKPDVLPITLLPKVVREVRVELARHEATGA